MISHNQIIKDLGKLEGVFNFNPNKIEQGSPEWLYMKLGVISASNAHKACGSKQARSTYMKHLLSQIFTSEMPEIKAKPMEWGKMHEGAARAQYEFEIGKEIIEYPIIYKDSSLRVGASPDGMIHDIATGNEIKCPWTTEVHLDLLLDQHIKKEYEFQMQHSMYVTGAECWHFSSYDPRMKVKPFVVKMVNRNDTFMKLFDDAYYDFIYYMDKLLEGVGFQFGQQWSLKEYKKLQDNSNAINPTTDNAQSEVVF